MIDIHSHILPGLDDGPETLAEALVLAAEAYKAGTRTLVATPHVLNSLDMNRNMQIINVFNQFKKRLAYELPDMKLILGSEIYFRPHLAKLAHLEVSTIDAGGLYMLVEFSLTDIPRGFEREIKELQRNGIIPIVAHPERNAAAIRRPNLIKQMIEAGALIQVNAGSLTDLFGRTVKNMAYNLLKRGWVQVIASDAHSHIHRGPSLQEAVSASAEVIGVANARRLVEDNPGRIVEGIPWPGRKQLEVVTGGV